MRHRPHLLVAGPWDAEAIGVPEAVSRHMAKVLRYPNGGAITYTDGAGSYGEGMWVDGSIARGEETKVARPTRLTIAVAPPKTKDRQRFVVEKAQELGVESLVWIGTDHGEGRRPADSKALAWSQSALEQSRGAWLTAVHGQTPVTALDPPVIGCDSDGMPVEAAIKALSGPTTLAIGPEGGWSDAERARFASLVSLGPTVLRVETAVVVGVTQFGHGTVG